MENDTAKVGAGDDLCITIDAPLRVSYFGTWEQMVELGAIKQDQEQPEANEAHWSSQHMRYVLKRKWRPGVRRSGTLKESGFWKLTILDSRYTWADVEAHEEMQREKRRMRVRLGHVSRARMDRPFSAWLKATCSAV